MNILLAQTVLLARNEDAEGWTNILVVVVMAVVWALGGIIKARKNAQSRQKTPSANKPVRKPSGQTAAWREQLLKGSEYYSGPARQRPAKPSPEQMRTKLAEWRSAARKLADEAEQAFRAQMELPASPQQPPKPPPLISQRPKPQAAAYVAPQVTVKSTFTPEQPPVCETPIESAEDYLSDLLADYDSDHLRRAILHYEILGKPLAFREPNESAIGF